MKFINAQQNWSKEELVRSLGVDITKLEEGELDEILDTVEAHLNEVIFQTVVNNLDEKGVEGLSEALIIGQNTFLRELELVTQGIPGILEKIEQAVENEIMVIRTARTQLQ